MFEDISFSDPTPWLQRVWQDLQPTPGRLSMALRMTLASILVLVLMLVLQMPYIAYGLYFVFLIGRESPSVSLRTSVALVASIALIIPAEMGVVIVSDNDPMARILSVAIATFIGGMILVSTSLPSLGGAIGFIYCVVIGFWEHNAPEDILVKNSLRLVAAFALAAACCVAVEYVFGARSPTDRLDDQFRIRYRALQEMFSLCAQQEVSTKQRLDAAARVSRLAVAGGAGMMDLYNQIVDRNLDTGSLPIGTRVQITMLAELMDHAAAFGLQSETRDDADIRHRCARIAEQCGRLIPAPIPQSTKRLDPQHQTTNSLLERVEAIIHSILVMPVDLGPAKNRELAVLPSKKVPFLIPGAIKDKDNIAFALKISLCATLCYIVYNAIDWPGLSTSVTTVMVTGLSTTAAMKQRFTLRVLGSLLGGLILGAGNHRVSLSLHGLDHLAYRPGGAGGVSRILARRRTKVQLPRCSGGVCLLPGGVFGLWCVHRVGACARPIRRDIVCGCCYVVRARSDLASTYGDRHAPGIGNRSQKRGRPFSAH